MKIDVDLDEETALELERTVSFVGEDRATVLRMAIRAGLSVVAGRFQAPRPEGFFAKDYEQVRDEQVELEKGFAKVKVMPDR